MMKRYDRKTDFAVSVLMALAFAYIGLIALGGVGFFLIWVLAIGLLVWWLVAKTNAGTNPQRTVSPDSDKGFHTGRKGATPTEAQCPYAGGSHARVRSEM